MIIKFQRMHSVVCNKQNSCFLINTDDIDGSYDCNGFLIVIVLHGYIVNPNSSRMFWTYSNNYCCYKTGHKNKQTKTLHLLSETLIKD